MWKVFASFENAHIPHQRLNSRKFLPKPHKTLGSAKGWFFLSLKEQKIFYVDFICFQERRKHLPATFTLKAGKVKVLDYLRKLGRDLQSFSSNLPLGCTYILYDNESMDDTNIKSLQSHEEKLWNPCQYLALNSPSCGDSCQRQIQILPNPRQDLSTLKCNWFSKPGSEFCWKQLPHIQQCLQKASETPAHPIRTNPTCAAE